MFLDFSNQPSQYFKSSFAVSEHSLLDNSHVARAFTSENSGFYSVNIVFSDKGSEKLKKVTERLKGKRLAIVIDERLITAPLIQEAISGGKVEVSGGFTKNDAEKIANGISPEN